MQFGASQTNGGAELANAKIGNRPQAARTLDNGDQFAPSLPAGSLASLRPLDHCPLAWAQSSAAVSV